jgi:hypothetical protein
VKIENRQTLLAVIAASAVGVWVADQFIFEPLWHAWSARAGTIRELRAKVLDGKNRIDGERRLRAAWDAIRTNALPDNLSLAEQRVLRSFDTWSQSSDTSIVSIAPQLRQDDDKSTLECRVEVTGNLASITRFIFEIENASVDLRLSGLELSARDAEGQELTAGLQVSGLILATDKP